MRKPLPAESFTAFRRQRLRAPPAAARSRLRRDRAAAGAPFRIRASPRRCRAAFRKSAESGHLFRRRPIGRRPFEKRNCKNPVKGLINSQNYGILYPKKRHKGRPAPQLDAERGDKPTAGRSAKSRKTKQETEWIRNENTGHRRRGGGHQNRSQAQAGGQNAGCDPAHQRPGHLLCGLRPAVLRRRTD